MSQNKTTYEETMTYRQLLGAHKEAIDAELHTIADELLNEAKTTYGPHAFDIMSVFVKVLLSGGKRIRGALVIESYLLFHGADMRFVLRIAALLEVLNTYLLVADDIMDQSDTRRGVQTVHVQLANYHAKNGFKGEKHHFGESMASVTYLTALHYALHAIAVYPADNATKIAIITYLNKNFSITGYGQLLDVLGESIGALAQEEIEHLITYKTAYYTFVNPLQLGAVMAGAPNEVVEALVPIGVYGGMAFQITDDIIGTFGSQKHTGKNNMDDIVQGKYTLLISKTIKNTNGNDAEFIQQSLGNASLSEEDFERCKAIIEQSGALEEAKQQASQYAQSALGLLNALPIQQSEPKEFIANTLRHVIERTA